MSFTNCDLCGTPWTEHATACGGDGFIEVAQTPDQPKSLAPGVVIRRVMDGSAVPYARESEYTEVAFDPTLTGPWLRDVVERLLMSKGNNQFVIRDELFAGLGMDGAKQDG